MLQIKKLLSLATQNLFQIKKSWNKKLLWILGHFWSILKDQDLENYSFVAFA